jgi:hypothetical protein
MNETLIHSQHVLSVGEVLWGILLTAITMAIHGVGMPATLSVARRTWRRWPPRHAFPSGVPVLILASWMIVVVHLVEVAVWSGFLVLRGAMPGVADAFYYTLCQYVTVGSDLSLPPRWRLEGGMISMAGLLTFAWSTSVLLALAQSYEDGLAAARSASEPGAPAQPGRRP